MNRDLTEIVSIIDRSGSMQSIKQDAIGGFNSFVAEQRRQPGTAKITVVLFNHDYELLYENAPPNDVALDEQNYVPAGTTAMLDAIGRTIDDVGERLSNTAEAERPGLVLVAILTDGLENASKDYSYSRVAEMIEHQKSKYSWEFVFLAANQDAVTAAQRIAIDPQRAVNFAATAAGTDQAFKAKSDMASAIRRERREK